jgi:hypothetical protein
MGNKAVALGLPSIVSGSSRFSACDQPSDQQQGKNAQALEREKADRKCGGSPMPVLNRDLRIHVSFVVKDEKEHGSYNENRGTMDDASFDTEACSHASEK